MRLLVNVVNQKKWNISCLFGTQCIWWWFSWWLTTQKTTVCTKPLKIPDLLNKLQSRLYPSENVSRFKKISLSLYPQNKSSPSDPLYGLIGSRIWDSPAPSWEFYCLHWVSPAGDTWGGSFGRARVSVWSAGRWWRHPALTVICWCTEPRADGCPQHRIWQYARNRPDQPDLAYLQNRERERKTDRSV